MIRINSVSYSVGSQKILDDISLEIPRGGITSLVGANGAGKSTLLALIARLTPLQTGTISVDDLVIGECPTDELARKLAILTQDNHVAPRLSVQELIGFGRYPYHKGRPTAVDFEKVEESISRFDLQDLRKRSLDSLSGGQRQRAQVAMTYAQDTDYVLLDEPLNNLDIAASRSLMQLLRRLAHDHGRSVIIVLHDLNYACSYADHMVTLIDGQIGNCGKPSEIVDSTLVRKVFGTETTVHNVDQVPVVMV